MVTKYHDISEISMENIVLTPGDGGETNDGHFGGGGGSGYRCLDYEGSYWLSRSCLASSKIKIINKHKVQSQ